MATLAPVAPGTLTEKQSEVYELIRKADGVIDNQVIAKKLGTTPNNVAQHVRKMRERGILPEKAARSNGGQRSPRRRATSTTSRAATATPPPPPVPPDPEDAPDMPYTELVNDVDVQAQKFIEVAQQRRDEIAETIAALDRQRDETLAAIDRQKQELTTAAVHLEAQIKGLGNAIDSQA